MKLIPLNSETTATPAEGNFFDGIIAAFQGIIDMIMSFINIIRGMVEDITKG